MSINIAVRRSKSNALNWSYEAPPDPPTPPSGNPAKEREIVEPETNAMQANLPKKCDRAPG
jgi:hypothetical protein